MLADLLLLFTALYLVQMVLFAVAAALAAYPSDSAYLPKVSIVIAARNEERNIGACLESLTNLTYPAAKLEIMIVDDRSTDGTQAIVKKFAGRHPTISLLVATPGSGQLRGKTNAVTQGIESTGGEIIMFTDADCAVPPRWVEETVKYYADERIGIVAGFTSLRADTPFAAMQAFDWFFLFSVAAATIRLHYPVTAVGNNLSVRRSAYEAAGGYRKIPFSVTEDYALFHAVTSQARFRARFPMNPLALVQSGACRTVKELHRQKLRWFTGGRDMDFKSMVIFSVSYLFDLLLLLSLFVSPEWVPAPLLCRIGADMLLMAPALTRFRKWKLAAVLPLFEVYYWIYVLLYPLLVLLGRKVVWKERVMGE